MADGKKKKSGKKTGPDWGWILFIFVITMVISAAMSFISSRLLGNAGMAVSFLILICIVAIGIVFDIIGVAVTAADPRPFHSMAAHKEKGAREALNLLRNASHVSSVCNDVVGDICGIVSGATGAVIVTQLQSALNTRTVLISVGVTALVSGLTIGGKALSKTFAMKQSTKVVYWVGRFLHVFHR